MRHNKYTVEDFIQDKSFREWVLTNDSEAAEYWNRWTADHPDQLPLIQEARKILRNIEFKEYELPSVEKRKLWERIENSTGETAKKQVSVRFLNVDRLKGDRKSNAGPRRVDMWNRKPVLRKISAAAAVLIFAVGIGLLLQVLRGEDAMVVYSTDYGQTRGITLEDGTGVVLNANTEVRVIPGWTDADAREVWVKGEAYFDVVQGENRPPLVVHAREVDAHVLGTSFNVFARDNQVRFELASGRLKLSDPSTRATLEMMPGEQVIFHEREDEPVRRTVDIRDVAAWRDNLLIFRRTSLAEIGELLKYNYGMDVSFEYESASQQFFTGTVPSDDVNQLLSTLSRIFNLDIERSGRTVIFRNDRNGP